MRLSARPPFAALIAAASVLATWGAGPAAAAPEKATLSVTNASPRPVDCALVIDGRMRTMLKIRPAKTWAEAFDPRRTVQLVCERAARDDGVWRVKAGTAYRFVDEGGKVGIAEGAE